MWFLRAVAGTWKPKRHEARIERQKGGVGRGPRAAGAVPFPLEPPKLLEQPNTNLESSSSLSVVTLN